MPVPALFDRLRLPAIGAPLFIVSCPDLVIAQCKAGIVGSFPALNARPQSLLDEWLHRINEELAAWDRDHPETPAAPYAVNQIVHRSNARLQEDMATCAKWKVPIVITSLGALVEVNQGMGQDRSTTSSTTASPARRRKAPTGSSPSRGAGGCRAARPRFGERRGWFDGLCLSGAIATGRGILAAQAMGADLGYIGSPFTTRSQCGPGYGRASREGCASIICSSLVPMHGNLKASIVRAGLDLPICEGDVRRWIWHGGSRRPGVEGYRGLGPRSARSAKSCPAEVWRNG
jgi:nitronate monooxygenase